MEAKCSSETSVDIQRTTRRYIPEDGTLHNHRCENLKSYITLLINIYNKFRDVVTDIHVHRVRDFKRIMGIMVWREISILTLYTSVFKACNE
jgi:hypothetical protein